MGSETGTTFVFSAIADKIETLAQNTLPGLCYTTPVIVGGRIYLRTDKELYCIGS